MAQLQQVPLKEDVGDFSVVITKKNETVRKYLFDFDSYSLCHRGVLWIFQDKRYLIGKFVYEVSFLIEFHFVNFEEGAAGSA